MSWLAVLLVCAIVLILGRLHSFYLDGTERILAGKRKLDRLFD
jgi:hypothetical protein